MAMKNLIAALPLTAALPALGASLGKGNASEKKGWAGDDSSAHKTFGAKWYYNWTPSGNGGDIEFVPMVKREADFSRLDDIAAMPGLKHLLGYNEPERPDQAHMSIEQGLKLWPKLVEVAAKKNIPLGSPAPSSDGGGMAWLTEFMRQAKRQKLRVDFIAIHWYRSRDAAAFAAWLNELERTFRLPVWVTEFNGWSGPEHENYEFLRSALRALEHSHHVERYAYFEPGAGKEHSLFKADGTLSRMGELYRDAGA
jgi:hypothetical protein